MRERIVTETHVIDLSGCLPDLGCCILALAIVVFAAFAAFIY